MKRFFCFILATFLLLGLVSCAEEQPSVPYYLFVYNSIGMTKQDMEAVAALGDLYDGYDIVMVDVRDEMDASGVYQMLVSVRAEKGIDPSGIQIFGTPSMVPSFELRYEMETNTGDGTTETILGDNFVSDYFYTNFNNDPTMFDEISAYQLSNQLDHIDILPQWPVVRLPLFGVHIAEFIEKYLEYLSMDGREHVTNISVSSPILPVGWYFVAMDDTGYFLMRARDEWKLIDDLHMYGTTEGVYASSLALEGNCDPENWAHLTQESVCEIYHDSHAGPNALLQTIFDGRGINDYHCREVLSTQTINEVLNGLPYFLNTSGCEPAKGMSDNIITTALRGQCMGAIASTTLVSNVEIDCMLSEEDYQLGHTKYSLLYGYLYAKHSGQTRTVAFCEGQKQVAAFLNDNTDTVAANSFQSNLNNLLGFHNFGVIDP